MNLFRATFPIGTLLGEPRKQHLHRTTQCQETIYAAASDTSELGPMLERAVAPQVAERNHFQFGSDPIRDWFRDEEMSDLPDEARSLVWDLLRLPPRLGSIQMDGFVLTMENSSFARLWLEAHEGDRRRVIVRDGDMPRDLSAIAFAVISSF